MTIGRPSARDRRRASTKRSTRSSITSVRAKMTSSWSAVGRMRGTREGGRASRKCARGVQASPALRPGPG
eukprot:6661145-Alexandrium_andersonii.AAC.1